MKITAKKLRERIERVDKDIADLQGNGSPVGAIDTLLMYKEYLEDELRFTEAEDDVRKQD